MLIKSEINPKFKELELHVCKDRSDIEVLGMLKDLHMLFDASLTGTDERGNRVKLAPAELISFYAEGQKVFALGPEERFSVSKKLYELEKELENAGFVRISKSELVNSKKIRSLDLSFTGTIKVIMSSGYETYTSRRNVSRIKEMIKR